MDSIPKIIHYCWVGKKEKPQEVIETIADWTRKLEGYKIIEWNEDNFDIGRTCNYVQEAYAAKKWAFVTDYMRLKVLYKYGGIYLDTDVSIVKSFDSLLEQPLFMGSESKYSICTAVIGAQAHSFLLRELLELYEGRRFIDKNGTMDQTPNSLYIYSFLNKRFGYMKSSLKKTEYDGCVIYPSEYFSPINYNTMRCNITDNTYAIHYYNGTWKGKKERTKGKVLAIITRIIGEDGREKLKRLLKR